MEPSLWRPHCATCSNRQGARLGAQRRIENRTTPPGVTEVKLWRFTETVYYCYDYGRCTVTSIATPETNAYIYGPGNIEGWKYKGTDNTPNNIAHKDIYGILLHELRASNI